ncbi:MAG: Nif11-like leader peptide family natural product precursor, partial [Coriobacteriales bacterium]|nr:Nif11-like leader peptide family natural product precursor [Coriobacteriales bacterium]
MFDVDGISPEVRDKARQCKTTEELVALAQSEGIELTDEMLDEISGGKLWGVVCTNHFWTRE